jgi:hypothetical protein
MGQSALVTETVEIVDPTHHLYGLTLPLLEITVKESLGRVCVVGLRPDVMRLIPLAATNLGGLFPHTSPCRLSPRRRHRPAECGSVSPTLESGGRSCAGLLIHRSARPFRTN